MAIKKTPIKKVAVNKKNKKKEKTKTRPKGKVKRLKTKSKPKKKKKTKTLDIEVKKKGKGDKTKSSSEKKKKEKEKMEKEKKEKEKLEKEKANKPKQPEGKADAAAKAENYNARYEKEVEKAKANAQYVGKIKEVPSKKALPPVKVAKSKVVAPPKAPQKESPAAMPAVAPAFAETSDILVAPGAPPPPTPKEVAKEQPVEVAADPLDSPTKKLAPDDFCHIFNAKENVLNGVKMSPEEVKANAAVDPPKIDLALVELEAVASAEDAPKKVEEVRQTAICHSCRSPHLLLNGIVLDCTGRLHSDIQR